MVLQAILLANGWTASAFCVAFGAAQAAVFMLIAYLAQKGESCMEALFIKAGTVLMQIVLRIGQMSTNVACVGPCYQPKVPEKMRKR